MGNNASEALQITIVPNDRVYTLFSTPSFLPSILFLRVQPGKPHRSTAESLASLSRVQRFSVRFGNVNMICFIYVRMWSILFLGWRYIMNALHVMERVGIWLLTSLILINPSIPFLQFRVPVVQSVGSWSFLMFTTVSQLVMDTSASLSKHPALLILNTESYFIDFY